MIAVLCNGQTHGYWLGDAEAEDVLQIVRDTWGVALPPEWQDLEVIADVPLAERGGRSDEPGFFFQLTECSLAGRFSFFQAAGDRLPVTGVAGTLNQQNLQIWGVDDYKYGFWPFIQIEFSLYFSIGSGFHPDMGQIGMVAYKQYPERYVLRLPAFDCLLKEFDKRGMGIGEVFPQHLAALKDDEVAIGLVP